MELMQLPASPDYLILVEQAGTEESSKRRCPLHKEIRNAAKSGLWQRVLSQIEQDPSQICQHNRVGWSSLILAIYHSAPIEIIATMLALVSAEERKILLSTPVPNGSRLCLHFATRFSSNLEVIKILTDPYPRALIAKSTDGVTPLDRAVYYRKDPDILNWLKSETQKQKDIYELERYNRKLRSVVMHCCESRCAFQFRESHDLKNGPHFVVRVYSYMYEREMIGMFSEILSYVGVHSIPSS